MSIKNRPRPGKLPPEWGWCGRPGHGMISPLENNECHKCKEQKRRRAEKLCCAVLGHGPGHQSSTYCEMKGRHTVHQCTYGCYGQVARWKGPAHKIKFTGYFDDPPDV